MQITSLLVHTVKSAAKGALIALLVTAIGVGTTFAGKGGQGGGPGGGSTGTSTLSIVFPDSTDGSAHYGQEVEFVVSTTVTDKPYVRLNCYESGIWVMTDSTGYYPDYPWPGHIFTLRWDPYHTPGAEADCTAALYYYTRKGTSTLISQSFRVYP